MRCKAAFDGVQTEISFFSFLHIKKQKLSFILFYFIFESSEDVDQKVQLFLSFFALVNSWRFSSIKLLCQGLFRLLLYPSLLDSLWKTKCRRCESVCRQATQTIPSMLTMSPSFPSHTQTPDNPNNALQKPWNGMHDKGKYKS